jgi:hypothetical protein
MPIIKILLELIRNANLRVVFYSKEKVFRLQDRKITPEEGNIFIEKEDDFLYLKG